MDNTADSTNVDTNSVANPAPEDQPQVNQEASTVSLEAQLAQANAELAKHKEAAAKWAEYEESQKTEAQKQAEQIAALQAENEKLKNSAAVRQIADKYGIAAENLPLLAGGSLEEVEARAKQVAKLQKQTAATAEKVPSGQAKQTVTPGSGDKPEAPATDYPLEWLPADVSAQLYGDK